MMLCIGKKCFGQSVKRASEEDFAAEIFGPLSVFAVRMKAVVLRDLWNEPHGVKPMLERVESH